MIWNHPDGSAKPPLGNLSSANRTAYRSALSLSGNGFPFSHRQTIKSRSGFNRPFETRASTSLAYGILASLDAIERLDGHTPPQGNELSPTPTPTPLPEGVFAPAVIVLLSDGENTAPPDPFEAAHKAAEQGVRIYTVGIGSPAGKTLEINGFNVHTQLDERTLQQIAQLTGGTYYHAGTEQELHTIYEDINLQLVSKPQKMEITSLLQEPAY
jgi:hypothetical protein